MSTEHITCLPSHQSNSFSYYSVLNSFLPYLLLSVLLPFLLTGCASKTSVQQPANVIYASEKRTDEIALLQHWKVKGKIAFITSTEKQSAGLSWHVNQALNTQQLNLNSYLGINVLDLNSKDDLHTIKVDGETYTGNNLATLIYDLTGLTLPTKALHYWLKGIAYNPEDEVLFNESTELPFQLTSLYQGRLWQISYQKYKNVDAYQLPTKINIRQGDLLIKIAISNWQVLP
ncbi:MAG: lipoprotein insertase outer membrane protein LolB [Colwellia sp.]